MKASLRFVIILRNTKTCECRFYGAVSFPFHDAQPPFIICILVQTIGGKYLIYDDIMTMLDIIVPKSLGMNFHKIAH